MNEPNLTNIHKFYTKMDFYPKDSSIKTINEILHFVQEATGIKFKMG
jgi:hypothetical protein